MFAFDALGRLTVHGFTGTRTLAASWQGVPYPDTLTPGGPTEVTAFDAADRPTGTGLSTDLDGRITALPGARGSPGDDLAYG